jgi:hypothetical protein
VDGTSTDLFSLTPEETGRRSAPVGVKVRPETDRMREREIDCHHEQEHFMFRRPVALIAESNSSHPLLDAQDVVVDGPQVEVG